MVGFTSELGESLDHLANLRSRNTALIFGQRKYKVSTCEYDRGCCLLNLLSCAKLGTWVRVGVGPFR